MKSDPETYSFEDLSRDKKTNWNEIRNYQARNYLRQVSRGDSVLIYHSGDERAVVGIAKVIREGYPDPDPENPGDWVQVDLQFQKSFSNPVTLEQIKKAPLLKSIPLVKQSRLSVMPLGEKEFEMICELGGVQ